MRCPKPNGRERNGTSTKYGAKDRRDYTDQRTPPIVVRKHHGVDLTREFSGNGINEERAAKPRATRSSLVSCNVR